MASLERLDSAEEDLRHLFGKIEKCLNDIDFIIKENDLNQDLNVKRISNDLKFNFDRLQKQIEMKRKERIKEL